MFQLPVMALLLMTGPDVSIDPNPAKLLPTAEQLTRSDELVRQLGSEDFAERDAASRELAEMGRLALAAVERALTETASTEVRARCEALLPMMLQEDLKARLAAFMADTEARYDHKLPGWDAFFKIVGNSKEARRLFAEMYEHPHTSRLIAASAGPKDEFSRLVLERRQDTYNRFYGRNRVVGPNGVLIQQERQQIAIQEITGLLFAESLLGTIADRRYSYMTSTLLNQPHIREALNDVEKGAMHRKLIAHWCDSRTDGLEQVQAVNLAANLNLPEISAPKLAVRALASKNLPVTSRANVICTLARVGGKEYLPEITKHLNDETVFTAAAVNVGGQIERVEMQVRDIALAMALVLMEKDVEDFGFDLRNKNVGTKFSYTTYLLKADKREAAFKKWHDSQPKK